MKYARRTSRALNRRESSDIRRYLLRHVFLQRNAVVEKARRYSLAIVDEGHLSNVFSAFDKPLTEHQLVREIKSFDLPDLVVRFTLPEEERKKRLEQRGYFVGSDEPEYLLRWERAMLANEVLLAELLERLQVPSITVDANVSLETLAAQVASSLQLETRHLVEPQTRLRPASTWFRSLTRFDEFLGRPRSVRAADEVDRPAMILAQALQDAAAIPQRLHDPVPKEGVQIRMKGRFADT